GGVAFQIQTMNATIGNSTASDYPLPAGFGDLVGTVAHFAVGLGVLWWARRCFGQMFAPPFFQYGTRAERLTFVWCAFWEALGPVVLLAVPATCYHSLECFQRNVHACDHKHPRWGRNGRVAQPAGCSPSPQLEPGTGERAAARLLPLLARSRFASRRQH